MCRIPEGVVFLCLNTGRWGTEFSLSGIMLIPFRSSLPSFSRGCDSSASDVECVVRELKGLSN